MWSRHSRRIEPMSLSTYAAACRWARGIHRRATGISGAPASRAKASSRSQRTPGLRTVIILRRWCLASTNLAVTFLPTWWSSTTSPRVRRPSFRRIERHQRHTGSAIGGRAMRRQRLYPHCDMGFGKDHRAYDLSLTILREEIEHEAWFSEFLGHGPSGHYSREGRPNSPYVGKFLNAGQ